MSEAPPQRTPTGSVVLDIGDGVGALVVYAPSSCWGQEIEVSRADTAARIHTDVLERCVDGSNLFAAVFASLPEGDYTVWRDALTPGAAVTVGSGQVAELDWR
ncbi:MAG TPA: phospholipase [Candidatus Dormibacteraeota bacterium]|jgi:hypothetical protein|nr:phospholipase [Candidatus Dormibacteraeota bacterium]